jgi:ABC-2 type transport system ATP-binding protein
MSEHLAIETKCLTRLHGRKRALDGLDLELPRGGIHAIVGANGAGKSTLFRVLLGFQEADAGSSVVMGRPSEGLTPADRARIGFVNEEHSLPPWAKVDTILRMQRTLFAERWDSAAFDAVLACFDISVGQRVGQLSRGERAGFNLALALAQAPDLLILDEPTLGLDVVARRRLLDSLIAAVADGARTIIYCSHQIDEIERLADTLVILERGRVTNVSSPDEFCGRITRWIADLPFKGPEAETVPGLLRHRRIDGIHDFIVIDQDERFADFLRELGGCTIRPMPIALDVAVDAFLTRNHAGPAI